MAIRNHKKITKTMTEQELRNAKTSELLAQWERLEELFQHIDPFKNHQQLDAVASELDRRSGKAGILIGDGLLTLTKFEDYEIHQLGKDYSPHVKFVTLNIQPEELRNLITWLILKGGTND